MPVAKSQAIQLMEGTRTEFVDRAIAVIDKCLQDRNFMVNGQYGGPTDPCWKINIEGVASEVDKQLLVEAYESAGWHRIWISNSGDYGEKDGRAMVILHRFNAPTTSHFLHNPDA